MRGIPKEPQDVGDCWEAENPALIIYGEVEIRTLDPAKRGNGFQDRRFQPLSHLSQKFSQKIFGTSNPFYG